MSILSDTVKHWRSTTFEWGQRDCLLSVGDYITACGGVDISGTLKGTYATEEEAFAIVKTHDGSDKLINMTGCEPASPTEVDDGDIVLFDTCLGGEGSMIAGIIYNKSVVARTLKGVIELSLRFVKITHCWKPPCRTL